MTFYQWVKDYFGNNVNVPNCWEACRDAWNAAKEEAAKIADENYGWLPDKTYSDNLGESIREKI